MADQPAGHRPLRGRPQRPQEVADVRLRRPGAHGLAEAGQARSTSPPFTNAVSREDDEGYNGFRTAVNDQIADRADELNDEAARSRQLYLGLALVAILVALLVTWLVSRSITRPLRSLTRQAKEMAERRLPEAVIDILETPLGDDVTVPTVDPVRVNTRDEVSDVADALNTVQDSALDLAVEQAVLRRNIADSFVNLGRRNQNLLGRQLDFITELETNETDADTLANLFRLDHLATRMRRNAESLLVLAGIDRPGSGRRRCGSPTSSGPPWARSRTTSGSRCGASSRHRHRLGRRRPGPPAGRAHRERPGVLAARPDGRHPRPQPARRLHAGHHRLGPRHAGRRRGRRQPAPGRGRVVHHRPVQVPGPLRGRQPGRPPRHPGPPGQLPGQRHHRHHRHPADPAHVRRPLGEPCRRPDRPRPWARRRSTRRRRRPRCRSPPPAPPPAAASPWPRSTCRRRPAGGARPAGRPGLPSCRQPPAPPAAWSSGPAGRASRRRPPRPSPTASCWPACRTSPTTCPALRWPATGRRPRSTRRRPPRCGRRLAPPPAPPPPPGHPARPADPPPATGPPGVPARRASRSWNVPPQACTRDAAGRWRRRPGSGARRRAASPAACGRAAPRDPAAERAPRARTPIAWRRRLSSR